MATPVGLSDQEHAVFNAINAARGRLITRTELARVAQVPVTPARRVDGLLINVRRALAPEELINVRRRGWMLEAELCRA